LKAQEKLEESQLLEQDTAWELISEASKKLTEALQQGQGNVQPVKVAQVMLSAGNVKFRLFYNCTVDCISSISSAGIIL